MFKTKGLYRSFAVLFAVLLMAGFSSSQDNPTLDLDRIFSRPEFNPSGLGGFRWRSDGNSYARLEPSTEYKGASDLVGYDLVTNQRSIILSASRLIPNGSKGPLSIHGYEWFGDGKKLLIFTNSVRVWRYNTKGDYWVFDTASGELKKLGGDSKPSSLMFAKFSPDGTRVGYVRDNDIYVETLADGNIVRLTSNGSPTMINGTSDWVNEEEFSLRDCWRWSPDGTSIAYWQFDASGIKDFLLLNNTDELYPTVTRIPYPKAGTVNAAVRVGTISAKGGETTWFRTPGDPRNNYIVLLEWAGNSDEVIIQHMNRLQNRTELFYGDRKTGNVGSFFTETDDAWVDVNDSEIQWLENGKRFLWLSERDGWRRAYSVSRDGREVRPITSGNSDLVSVQAVDEKGGWLYYSASPENATQRYLYRTKLTGGTAEQVTRPSDAGTNNYNISPNNRWAIHTHSKFGSAPRIDLVDLYTKQPVRTMVDNSPLQKRLDQISKGGHEFFKADVGDGVQLDGWLIKPPGFNPTKKYPILFYVYGEPAGQTVTDSWGGRNYLWHLLLAQKGYIVASVDNRGTPAPKGREWRKSIYRKIGVLNSRDQAQAVKALTAKHSFIDASRVGIWGWSGGGSSTLNALFRYPEIYHLGMSVAPVADIRYYDTIYQERYVGLPDKNADDYKNGSPMTFAAGLKGDLLIVHGTGDDNVHYQATELLINDLIKLNKHFTMMAYPNRSHGISEGPNTTRHLFGLLTRYLEENMPAGPAK